MSDTNPLESAGKAEENYLKEFNNFISNWHKLYDYIKPFVEQNKEQMEIVANINASMVVLPVSHMLINTMHMVNIKMIRDMTKLTVPPLKIECPTCKKVVWDVSEIRNFLDPEGKIYGKQ